MHPGKIYQVGLAIGRGTGAELSDVFENVIHQLSIKYGVHIELFRSSRVYHSYNSLIAEYDDPTTVNEETDLDVKHYEAFCVECMSNGCVAIFRTAINAQSLYLVRQHQEALKVEIFNQGENSLLLVRDEAQGFYTGTNVHDTAEGVVTRSCKFSKEMTGRIISYSIERARELWGSVDKVNMVYKFHLFDAVFSIWAKEWSKEFGVKIEFVQPDTANRNLLAFGVQGKQLIIAGNEWADIMHVMLLHMLGQGAQESRCTKNVYLHPSVAGLSEYQTVHGSADDIEGKGIVNPAATIRAAAAILERDCGCKGAEADVDHALQALALQKKWTPDQGGKMSTKEAMEAFLNVTLKPINGVKMPKVHGLESVQ